MPMYKRFKKLTDTITGKSIMDKGKKNLNPKCLLVKKAYISFEDEKNV